MRGVHELDFAEVDARVAEAVEEDEVADLHLAARHRGNALQIAPV